TYVRGSYVLEGLMFLRVYVDRSFAEHDPLDPAARALGAAFQKVNFLRDLAEDHDQLGRAYFPGLDPDAFDDAHRDRLLDDIDADLAHAASALPQLPASSRRAVGAAHGLYAALSRRLRAPPAAQL